MYVDLGCLGGKTLRRSVSGCAGLKPRVAEQRLHTENLRGHCGHGLNASTYQTRGKPYVPTARNPGH